MLQPVFRNAGINADVYDTSRKVRKKVKVLYQLEPCYRSLSRGLWKNTPASECRRGNHPMNAHVPAQVAYCHRLSDFQSDSRTCKLCIHVNRVGVYCTNYFRDADVTAVYRNSKVVRLRWRYIYTYALIADVVRTEYHPVEGLMQSPGKHRDTVCMSRKSNFMVVKQNFRINPTPTPLWFKTMSLPWVVLPRSI